MLNRLSTRLDGLMLFETRQFQDIRGVFTEVFQAEKYAALGLTVPFVQDNMSLSMPGVLRGMHIQAPNAQGKLVRALQGGIYDVVVDLRVGSATFGQWEAFELSSENGRSLYIPEGFAHGFQVVHGPAIVLYKCTAYWDAACELTLKWDDPTVGIEWPEVFTRVISPKDLAGVGLNELPLDRLEKYAG